MSFEQPLENNEEETEGVDQEKGQERQSMLCPNEVTSIAKQVAEEMGLEITIEPDKEYQEMSDVVFSSSIDTEKLKDFREKVLEKRHKESPERE